MRRPIAIVVALLMARAAFADAPPPDHWLPPGTRTVDGVLVASRGLRDTSDAIAKELDRRGIAVKQVGPYRVRGVEVTRFISLTGSTSWTAIHVSRIAGGRTTIAFVGRPIAAAVPP